MDLGGSRRNSLSVSAQDFIDNREEVLALLARYDHVRLSLHGHVHANSIATRGGVVFVTTASAAEYPMHWREVSVYECEERLVAAEMQPRCSRGMAEM